MPKFPTERELIDALKQERQLLRDMLSMAMSILGSGYDPTADRMELDANYDAYMKAKANMLFVI